MGGGLAGRAGTIAVAGLAVALVARRTSIASRLVAAAALRVAQALEYHSERTNTEMVESGNWIAADER
jgi:hypothetical protein